MRRWRLAAVLLLSSCAAASGGPRTLTVREDDLLNILRGLDGSTLTLTDSAAALREAQAQVCRGPDANTPPPMPLQRLCIAVNSHLTKVGQHTRITKEASDAGWSAITKASQTSSPQIDLSQVAAILLKLLPIVLGG